MIMWARNRVRTQALDEAGNAATISSAAPTTPRATTRVSAISSAGIDASPTSATSGANQVVTTGAPSSSRRPGVEARWKEQNRVPYPRAL